MQVSNTPQQNIVSYDAGLKTFVIDYRYRGERIKKNISVKSLNESFGKARKKYGTKL